MKRTHLLFDFMILKNILNQVKCLERGVDLLCAQGTEAGGHTGTHSFDKTFFDG